METLIQHLLVVVAICVGFAALLGALVIIRRVRWKTDWSVDWAMEYVWTILLVVVGMAIFFYFGVYGSSSESPSLADVVKWSRSHWFSVLILLTIAAILVAINAKGSTAKTLQWVLVGIVAMLYVGVPLLDTFFGEKPPPPRSVPTVPQALSRARNDCTFARPCRQVLQPDGSAVPVTVPVGTHGVCFDPPVFANVEGFGFMISSGDGPMHRYGCTLEEVANRTCREGPIKTFQFFPKSGVVPPRHWFLDGNEVVCPN